MSGSALMQGPEVHASHHERETKVRGALREARSHHAGIYGHPGCRGLGQRQRGGRVDAVERREDVACDWRAHRRSRVGWNVRAERLPTAVAQ